MNSSRLGDVLAGAILAGLLALSIRRTGPLPALGPLLDPANGVWSVARQAELPATASGVVPGLLGPVRIRYDQRGVPHIFAASETDAIRALGYVVARDRLLQMELQWRAGAGRLTESTSAMFALEQRMHEAADSHCASSATSLASPHAAAENQGPASTPLVRQ